MSWKVTYDGATWGFRFADEHSGYAQWGFDSKESAKAALAEYQQAYESR